MNESRSRLLSLQDEALPALPDMLGPDAAAMLAAALESQGARISGARLPQVTWWPGTASPSSTRRR
jgi:hypothetical protein